MKPSCDNDYYENTLLDHEIESNNVTALNLARINRHLKSKIGEREHQERKYMPHSKVDQCDTSKR